MRYYGIFCLVLFTFFSCNSQSVKIQNIKPTRVISADSIPEPIGFVNDFEHLFSAVEVVQLDSIIRKHQQKSNNQICIVTLDSSYTNKIDFDTFVFQLHNTWGVGEQVKNNGVVIAVSKQLRKVRINNGYGIEAIISNEQAKVIIEKIMIPQFKDGHFFEGIRDGLLAVIECLEK